MEMSIFLKGPLKEINKVIYIYLISKKWDD